MKGKTYDQGEIIFRQGDPAASMFDIRAGQVGIYANYGTVDVKQLAILGEEEFFGEMGLIEGCPRSATAVSLAEGTVLQEISEEEFSEYFKDKPVKVFRIMQQLSQRLRETTRDYVEACRTVYEAVETEKSGKPKSSWLKEHLQLFYDVYRNSGRVK